MMTTEEKYKNAEKEILKMIEENDYPQGHPFLDYPTTPESMPIKMLIIIYIFSGKKSMVENFITKCNGKENAQFSHKKYREGLSELIWLYYLIVSLYKRNQLLPNNYYDEDYVLLNNGRKFEYSFSFENPSCITAFEVKALSCDPFDREAGGLSAIDGQKIIKPFFPTLKGNEFLATQTDAIVLESSTHYNQLVKNISRINEKSTGDNLTDKQIYFFGVIFITTATSIEEFYSYIFNEEYGLYDMIKRSKIDVLIIASLDAKNDFQLDNLYAKKYIQTIIPHPTDELKSLCTAMRLDNYIALGDEIDEYVKEKSKELYGFYKILNRRGIINIIPQDATDKEIDEYLDSLMD